MVDIIQKAKAFWRWRNGEKQFEIEDISKLKWGKALNDSRMFTFTTKLTDKTMEITQAGELELEIDGVLHFGGEIIDKEIDEDKQIIEIGVQDWMGKLNDIETTHYAHNGIIDAATGDWDTTPAAGFAFPVEITDVDNWKPLTMEASAFIKEILNLYTGRTATDSEYQDENGEYPFILQSDVTEAFRYNDKGITNIFKEVAQVSSVDSNPSNPFCFFIDPDKSPHFEPCGHGLGQNDLLITGLKYKESIRKMVNSVKLFVKGRPDTPTDDWWCEGDAAGWNNPGAGNFAAPVESFEHTRKGSIATKVEPNGAANSFYLERDGSNAGELLSSGTGTLDLSDGATSTVNGIESVILSVLFDEGAGGDDVALIGDIVVTLYDNAGAPVTAQFIYDLTPAAAGGGGDAVGKNTWYDIIMPVDNATVGAGFDWSNVEVMWFQIDIRPPNVNMQHFIVWLDGVRFRWKNEFALVQDTTSIQNFGLKRKIYKMTDYIDPVLAQQLANSLLFQQRNQSLQIPFVLDGISDLKLNDIVTLDIEGKPFSFPVVDLKYEWNDKKGVTNVIIGSNDRGFKKELKEIKVKELQTEKDLNKFDPAEFKVFDYGSCRFQSNCENNCEVGCMARACQGDIQVLCNALGCEDITQTTPQHRKLSNFFTTCVACETCIVGGGIVTSWRV